MLFKIKDLKKILSGIAKHKVENIRIKSQNSLLVINMEKKRHKLSMNTLQSLNYFNQKTDQESIIKLQNKEKVQTTQKEQEQYFTIVSPMIGTFYRSPAPNEAPFIDIQDTVQVNQTVCIIEAMKLMNEIESEVNGHIAEILVEDGDIVDCGQALIRIKQEEQKVKA